MNKLIATHINDIEYLTSQIARLSSGINIFEEPKVRIAMESLTGPQIVDLFSKCKELEFIAEKVIPEDKNKALVWRLFNRFHNNPELFFSRISDALDKLGLIGDEESQKTRKMLQIDSGNLSGLELMDLKFADMDLSAINFKGAKLINCFFQNCTGIEVLNKAASLVFVKFIDQDMQGFQYSSVKRLRFLRAYNLVPGINSVGDFISFQFDDVSLKGIEFSGKDCSGLWLERCRDLDVRSLKNASTIDNMKIKGMSDFFATLGGVWGMMFTLNMLEE